MDKIQVARVAELSQKISQVELHTTSSKKKTEEVGVVVESQTEKWRVRKFLGKFHSTFTFRRNWMICWLLTARFVA
jgi:hypothetical protein